MKGSLLNELEEISKSREMWMKDAKRYAENARFWREKAEALEAQVPRWRSVEDEPPEEGQLIAVAERDGEWYGDLYEVGGNGCDWDWWMPMAWPAPPEPEPTVIINGMEIPEPCYAPENDVEHWRVDGWGPTRLLYHSSMPAHRKMRDAGMLHTTREAAQAHYEALISPTRRAND